MLILLTTITTHAQNKLLSSIREYYDGNSWQNSSGENYEYDSNNNLITETYLYWSDDAWRISDKGTYTYNASNKVIEILSQTYDFITNTFENADKETYTYTAAGKPAEIVFYVWNGSIWVNDYKIEVTYNANNLPETALSYTFNGTQWVNDGRNSFAYNGNNKISTSVTEELIDAQWGNTYKSLYTYDVNNKLTLERGANWDDFNGWVEIDRTDYVLDATGNRISKTIDQNDYRYKDEYTYDSFNQMSSFANPFKDKTGVDYFTEDFPYVNKVQVENGYSYNSQTNSFYLSNRTTYNYNTAITLSTKTIEKGNATVAVYPNPTHDYLNIQNESNTEIDTLAVTDLTGKKVLEQNKTTQIDVRNLAKGMYVLGIISGKNKETTKFIKE
jgi:hypothetical protein